MNNSLVPRKEKIMLEDIKNAVEKFGETTFADGDWFFIIKKEFVNEIEKWLYEYSHSEEGSWFGYDLVPSKNEPEIYILRFYS